MIPYGRQSIDEADIQAVMEVLRSDYLTTGPKIAEFEESLAASVGARHAVAVSSGTAALHSAMVALDIKPGDEVILSPLTFAATANCVLYQGGVPVFADVQPDTLLIDPREVEKKITPRTKAIIAVDYAGQPCDYDRLKGVAERHGLALVADACHSIGAEYRGAKVGTLADLTCFSFHPVKHITTGEGGMVVTDDASFAEKIRRFRNHGISSDHRQREQQGAYFYEMVELGFNYRLTDLQCALGASQLQRLPAWVARRQQIAAAYDAAFGGTAIRPLLKSTEVNHGYHLYVVRVAERDRVFTAMRDMGIGVNVHYVPVYLHPYYRKRFGTGPGVCPMAEKAFGEILSLPIYSALTDEQVIQVVDSLSTCVAASLS